VQYRPGLFERRAESGGVGMELIKIMDFKKMIESSTNKRLHKTTFARYKKRGLVPKTKKGAKSLRVDVQKSISKIVEYESKSFSEKIKLGNERKFIESTGGLAFNLMNKCVRA